MCSLTLIDVAKSLRKLGRGLEADYYITTFPMLLHHRGFNLEDTYVMTLEEIEFELNKPVDPPGWDVTVWGKKVLCPQ